MQEIIAKLIAKVQGNDAIATQIHGSSHLTQEIGLDSLQLINLVLLIESEFDVEIDFASFEMQHLESLDKFCAYVTAQKGAVTAMEQTQ